MLIWFELIYYSVNLLSQKYVFDAEEIGLHLFFK